MMKSPLHSALVLLLSVPFLASAQAAFPAQPAPVPKLPLVAVSELTSYGVDSNTVRIFTDRLRSEITKSGHFQVIEREQMNDILTEQAFQQSGCVKEECVVQMGQLLGVDYLISGSVGLTGNTWSFSVKMVNITTGRIENTVDEVSENTVADVLSKTLVNLVVKLIRSRAGESGGVQISGMGSGDLFVESVPSGAKIWVDDVLQDKVTPTTVKGLSSGGRQVRLQKDSLFAIDRVDIVPDGLVKKRYTLSASIGQLKVLSTPPGAKVVIAGAKQKERTPALYGSLPLGRQNVSLQMDGYLPWSVEVDLKPGQTAEVNANLVQGASLSISADQVDYSAKLDKDNSVFRSKGITLDLVVAPEPLQLTLSKTDYRDVVLLLEPKPGEILERKVVFQHTEEFLKSQHRFRVNVVRWSLAAATVGAGVVGWWANTQVDDANKKYRASQTQSEFDSNWDKVESWQTTRNVSYIAAAVLAAGFGVTFAF